MPPRPTPNRSTPRCDGVALVSPPGELASAIPLDAPEWPAWLRDPAHATFAYAGPTGSFTARRDRRGDRAYWYAYRRQGGCVRKAYLGKVEQVTVAKLAMVAATLCQSTAAPARAVMRPTRLPGNLPASLTSFVERERELVEVAGYLNAARLLTLTGAGGVGKSRLALAVAQAVRAEYRDGAWLVALAPLAEPALAPAAVAGALGLVETPGQPLTDALANWLASRQVLLLLDNCEHLIDACARLADALLRACPSLVILTTSREPLRVAGEVCWRVPSLAVPDRPAMSAEEVGQVPAARLFVERARAVQPRFTLTAANAPAVAEVCRRLDGIPLALELAAARVASLSVEQIVTRLDDQLRLLTGGDRIGSLRQQTLRATIDWSYDLLSEAERVLLRRLSIFAGGWSLEAAEGVCVGDGIETHAVLDLLARLVERSLVQAEAGEAGEARYWLLEPVRQYAAARLVEAGEEAAAHVQHRDWCLELAEQAALALHRPEQQAWLARLEVENDNLRVALERALAAPDGATAGLRLAGALRWFWLLRDRHNEGRAWLERALTRRADAPPAAALAALDGAMFLAHRNGDNERAAARGRELLAWRRAAGDRTGTISALIWLGAGAENGGDYDGARALLDEGLAVARTAGDPWSLAMALHFRGTLAYAEGEYTAARAWIEEGLALFRRVGDRLLVALVLSWLGDVIARQGEYGRARALQEESLALKRVMGMRWGIVVSFHRLGVVAQLEGDATGAEVRFAEALRLAKDGGDRPVILQILAGLAWVAAARREGTRAARLFRAVAAVRAALGLVVPVGERAQHERALATARALLGEEAFAAAWAAGQALTLEEAVAEALEGLATPTSPSDPFASVQPSDPRVSPALSAREWEVAERITRGLTNRQVAAELSISPRTVDRHVENILNKLDLSVRAQVAAWVVARRGRGAPIPDA